MFLLEVMRRTQGILERISTGCVAETQESHAIGKAVAAANLIDGLLRLGDHRINCPIPSISVIMVSPGRSQ
jgi:hypothetical protein